MEPLHLLYVLLWAIVIGTGASKDADAAQSSISYLHGDGYVSGDKTRNVVMFDTTKVGEYGLVYARGDVSSMDDGNATLNSRIIGHLGTSLHLAWQAQNSTGVSNTAIGIGYDKIGKTTSWGIDVARLSSNAYGDGIHYFGFVKTPLVGNLYFDGWAEYFQREKGVNVLFMQPSVMYQLGDWSVGVEYQVAYNKNGVENLDESVPQVKLKMVF